MPQIAQNLEATREGLQFMREGVATCTEAVDSSYRQLLDLGASGGMSGPAYTQFSFVYEEWLQGMRAEIQRLNDFAVLGEGIVNQQEAAEQGRTQAQAELRPVETPRTPSQPAASG